VVRIGAVLWIQTADDAEHLFAVISDPQRCPSPVVLVPFTTHEFYKEESCVLYAGDHPRIHHGTCVDYRGAKLLDVQQIVDAITAGRARQVEPLTDEVLAKVLLGAAESRFLPGECDQILHSQGLIP